MILTAVHLLTSPRSVDPVRKADESKALCPSSLPVLRQEYPGDPSEPLEHGTQVSLLGHLADVCNSESGSIVAVVAAAHLVSSSSSTPTKMWRNICRLACAQSSLRILCLVADRGWVSDLVEWLKGVLEGTSRGEMVSLTDTALNLLVSQLILDDGVLGGLLLRARLPVGTGLEHDVFSDGGGRKVGAAGVSLLSAKLDPFPPLRNSGIDVLPLDSRPNLPCRLDLLALVVHTVGDDGLGAIGVLNNLLRWEIILFVVRPVVLLSDGRQGLLMWG